MSTGAPRRVLFLARAPFFSGAERALVRTLSSLDPARYKPRVLVGTDGELAAEVRAMGIPCDIVDLGPIERRRPVGSALSVFAVIASAVRHRASLIHANDAPSFQPGGYAARVLKLPAVTHVRFPDNAEGYRWFLRPGFSLALFVSRDQRETALREAPGWFDHRSDVLYDAVVCQDLWSDGDVVRTRRELGLPEHQTIVAITGQIAEVKGIWDFVEAAKIVASSNPEPFFVVLGDDLQNAGRLRRDMEARVAAAGLSARFAFLGFHKDAPRLVQAFDIVAAPSHVEPLGLSALEAMAAGRAVVATRVGGIPETVLDGETGWLVPRARPSALADAIARLVGDRDARERMGSAGRRRVRDAFSVEVHGRRLQSFYDRLCATSGVGAAAESTVA